MRGIELEEGEAYFVQDDDDDENIDPDRDFSYIDRKIENVLGQYQKDFMGGLSAESLGARFGGYGSFLPMQQRSPPILSNQRNLNHVSSKSPHDLPSERFHQNPTIVANYSLPARSIPASGDQSVEPMVELGISSTNNQSKFQNTGDFASNHEKQEPTMHYSEKNTLKFRVKMASENISYLDNSAIYSGLGLDMSPSTSPEDSPSENDGIITGLQERNLESPSVIVKTMTTMPIPKNYLLSPLHDSLVSLRGMQNNPETGLPGVGEALPANVINESRYLKGKKEARKERKSKVKDASKVKKSKHKEATEERKSKQKAQSQKPVELMKENHEHPANIAALSAIRWEENGISTATEAISNASISAVDAYSEDKEHASMMSKSTGSMPSFVFDRKNEVGYLGEDIGNPIKQAVLDSHNAKEEPGSAKKHDAEEDVVNAITIREKTRKERNFIPGIKSSIEKKDEVGWRGDEVIMLSKQHNISKDKVKEEVLDSSHHKDKNAALIPKSEFSTEKRIEGRRENSVNTFLKERSMAKDKVKEEVQDLACPLEAGVYRKENRIVETIPKDMDVCFLSLEDEENVKYNDISQEMKYEDVETFESLRQKSLSREVTRSPTHQGLHNEENSSSIVKKKLKDRQIVGFSAAASPGGSLIVCSSAANNEVVISKNRFPSKHKKGDKDLHREMRKNNEVVGKAKSRKKGKEVRSKDFRMRVSEQETQSFTTKLKDKSSSNKTSLASNVGTDTEGNLAGVNRTTEKGLVGDMPLAENAPMLTVENWVECDKCHKWRLLPLGMSVNSLTEWTCSMLTWLPGMNKCKMSEEETTNALRALYVPLDPASLVQNNQPAVLDANASVSAGALNVALPSQAPSFDAFPSGGKKKNLMKTEIDEVRQSAVQDLHIPVKKDQQRLGEIRNSKNLKKLPRESDSARRSGDGKLPKIVRKRVADNEVCGASKKMKRVHQRPIEDYHPGALRAPRDFAKGSPKYPAVKAKDRTQSDMTSKGVEMYDVSGKKRKLKDKQQRVYSTTVSGKGGHAVNDWDSEKNNGAEHWKEKKSKVLNFQGREISADKGHHRTQSDDAKSNLGGVGVSNLHKGARSDDVPLDKYHVNKVSRKRLGGKISSDMALDLGLSDNATTSSSSKVSSKVKAKVHEVKSSPVGSISSSPIKVSKPESDKGTSKKSVSYNEQRLKSGADCATNEFAPHNEGFQDRRSNLSRNSGIMSDAVDEDHSGKKVSSSRHSSAHAMDTPQKLDDYKHTSGKLHPRLDGTSTSLENLVAENQMTKSPKKLHIDGTKSEKGKSHVSKIDSKKEISSNTHGAPEFDGGSESNGGRVNNINGKPLKQAAAGHVSLRQSHHTGNVSSDIEASSSRKKDSFHRAAKTALREATDLKHSANRLKVAGSGLESTGIFFQAALKFLHGASLLEPGNNENRSGEMSPNEVYSSTAKLCEYCALEYERCNDMASAALAYKCMEVAYMRVVYCNDLVASRDRQELQMAVRAAPQVESPSSSASDIDNLNQAAMDTVKDGHFAMDHRNHVVSAGNRPNFMRLLDFTYDINLAMEASRRSQGAFAAAMPVFTQAGNEEGISSVKSVLDFSFHDVDGLLHLVRLAMESIKP